MTNKNALVCKLIILAAGRSTRFEGNKLLEPYGTSTVLESLLEKVVQTIFQDSLMCQDAGDLKNSQLYQAEGCLQGATAQGCKMDLGEVVLVTTQETLSGILLDTCRIRIGKLPLQVVLNPMPEEGISHSIFLGLEAAGEADVYGFLVADQLALSSKTIQEMLLTYPKCKKGILCARHGETLGNPVFFHRDYKEALKQLQGDKGGKVVLKQHLDDVAYFEIKEALELQDLDSKKDWTYFKKEK
ncbi:MAG: nucleotidyltransferase family protein [Niameybacter sp.]|uniref:nucleotidyltransferase family protein n=1 Tax=Niameybacter sp. TaxID=2033640 RepID=UPI002FC73406